MMPSNHDEHAHRNPELVEEPLDAASQSLADALRASFSVLKGIMMILIVLYLVSNIRSIEAHQEALMLRMGELRQVVRKPGLVWAFPFPIDEIVPLPTKKSNDMLIDSHTLHRSAQEKGKPISFLIRPPNRGLHPTLDGALLTADAGLVHVQWKITFKIDEVSDYVTEIAGDDLQAAEQLIKVMVETVGVHLASELTAEEMIRTRIEYVQREMRRRINERLAAIKSGVTVTLVEMYEPTPPVQIRKSFDSTQSAENLKQKKIRAAQQERTRILNQAAGAAYPRLIALLDSIETASAQGDPVDGLRSQLDEMLQEEVEGEAGKRIKQAGAYRATVVSRMESDVEFYRTLLPEYRRNPKMLINRLWEETKQRILRSPGVTKIYRPSGLYQFRIKIPLDPEQRRIEERRRLQLEAAAARPSQQQHLRPLGPEHD